MAIGSRPPEPELESHPWPRFMTHPLVNFIGFIIGLAGFVLAFVFFYVSRVERRPFYHLEPARNVIVNRDLAVGQKLTVSYDGQALSAKNVTAMQCHFWNAGRGSIRQENILQPVRLRVGEQAEILDAAVIRQTRPGVVNFRISPDRASGGSWTSTATMAFDILEQGDGATLQIVYIGGPSAPVTFDGTIEGAKISRLERPLEQTDEGGSRRWASSALGRRTLVRLLLVAYAFLPLFIHTLRRSGGIPFYRSREFWLRQLVFLIFVGGFYYYLFMSYPEVPPGLMG